MCQDDLSLRVANVLHGMQRCHSCLQSGVIGKAYVL